MHSSVSRFSSSATSSFVKEICSRSVNDVSVRYEKKYGFIGRIFNVGNENITFSSKGGKASFKSKELFSIVDKAVKSVKGGNNKPEWFKQETINILSSEINKVIDAACRQYGNVISEREKSNIFHKLSSGLGEINLDQRCTQSSISHALYNNKSLSDKVEGLYMPSQPAIEKNKLRHLVNSKLTDVIFMRKFGGIDLNLLRQKTAEEVALLLKVKGHKSRPLPKN